MRGFLAQLRRLSLGSGKRCSGRVLTPEKVYIQREMPSRGSRDRCTRIYPAGMLAVLRGGAHDGCGCQERAEGGLDTGRFHQAQAARVASSSWKNHGEWAWRQQSVQGIKHQTREPRPPPVCKWEQRKQPPALTEQTFAECPCGQDRIVSYPGGHGAVPTKSHVEQETPGLTPHWPQAVSSSITDATNIHSRGSQPELTSEIPSSWYSCL